jgi:hypothetical protein
LMQWHSRSGPIIGRTPPPRMLHRVFHNGGKSK